jgi:hypothetical protein
LSYALDVLTLEGVLLFSNVQRMYLGDPRLEPVFTELERRAATVFVHPNPSPPLKLFPRLAGSAFPPGTSPRL